MPSFSRPLEDTLQRALVYANERRHEYATLEHLLLALIDDTDAMLMHMQHDAGRVLAALLEEPLQHIDDEFHGRVVVVQDQHPIQRGLLELGLCLGDRGGAEASTLLIAWPS